MIPKIFIFLTASLFIIVGYAYNGGSTSDDQALLFNPHRHELYSREELWSGYDSNPQKNSSFDWKVFAYFTKRAKYNPPLTELIAQRSHDSGMDSAIGRFFNVDDLGVPTNQRVVVIMGSHSTLRSDPQYQKVAKLAFDLTRAGYYIVTGGGPGMMEAAHVGAYMSSYNLGDLNSALSILALSSPPPLGSGLKQYEMFDYWSRAIEVTAKFPDGADSLGIPTWFYGHEGANAFSLHIAKYFSNAMREEKICALGIFGAIYADGGPGTQQEAFMDAAENGYASYNWYSSMVFFSEQQSAKEIKKLITKTTTPAYRNLNMMLVTNESNQVISFLATHPPVKITPPKPHIRGS